MRRRIVTVMAALVVFAGATAALAQPAADEGQLIAVLEGQRDPVAMDKACQALKRLGTAKAVPALAKLLADEELGMSARYALETIPGPEASAALREALKATAGPTKAGIIDSIGARRDAEAVPALAELLADQDGAIATAAATALGRIGTTEAASALTRSLAKLQGTSRHAAIDGFLACAESMLRSGKASVALEMYGLVYEGMPAPHKAAGYRGMVLSMGDGGPGMLVKGLQGAEPEARRAALQLARELPGTEVTKMVAGTLGNAPAETRVLILAALAQRGDAAAAPNVKALVGADSEDVRVAALSALGSIGDASCAMPLAEAAATRTGREQDAARQALASMRDPKTGEALLAGLASADAKVQAEVVRALGARQDRAAVPALLALAGGADAGARMLALKSLVTLAGPEHVPALVKLLTAAKDERELAQAEVALFATAARGGKGAESAPVVIAAMKEAASVSARAALLRVGGRLGGPEALVALREGLASNDDVIRDAALRTMAEYAPAAAAPDLLKVASDGQRPVPQRVIALRGYWRLVGAAADLPIDERWKMAEAGLAASPRPEDRRLGLAQLGSVPHPAALKLADSLRADAVVGGEAEGAAVQVARALVSSHPAEARAVLRSVAKEGKSESARTEAVKALEAMDKSVGFITAWSVAGPYRQDGKQCAELFDIPFAPEQQGGQGGKVTWKRLPPPSDPALAWQADLLPTAGGDQAVVYARARVWSPAAQKVRLEIGSDDGNKIWINGKLAHAKNVQRPIAPAQDVTEATLAEGWNDVLVKVTQNIMGCAVGIRIRNPDGSAIDGLRFDAGAP